MPNGSMQDVGRAAPHVGEKEESATPAHLAAIIVTYFPDGARLTALVGALRAQGVTLVVVADNTPSRADLAALTGQAEVLHLERNAGVAFAQNAGIERALAAGADHLLIFDQDSAPPAGFVAGLLRAERQVLAAGIPVGAVGPRFVDEKTGRTAKVCCFNWWGKQEIAIGGRTSPLPVDHVISSGSLIRAEVLREVGGMIDALFIDWVDIEWCLRAGRRGFPIFVAPDVVMEHSLGYKVVKVLGRDLILHNNFRNYFVLRNALLLLKLAQIGWKKKLGVLAFVLTRVIPRNLVSFPEKWELLSAYRRALADAFATPADSLRYRVFD